MPRAALTADDLVRLQERLAAKRVEERIRTGRWRHGRGSEGPTYYDDEDTEEPDGGGTGPGGSSGGDGFANPMEVAGDLIEGGEAGGADRLPIGAVGQLLTVVQVDGEPRARWRSLSGGTDGSDGGPGLDLRYRSPLYSTYGGGSLLFDSSGHLMYTLEPLESMTAVAAGAVAPEPVPGKRPVVTKPQRTARTVRRAATILTPSILAGSDPMAIDNRVALVRPPRRLGRRLGRIVALPGGR